MACYASTVIAIAAAEIGYKEKASNSQLDNKTANAGHANYTKYARDFDEKYTDWYNYKKQTVAWCDMFVDWVFIQAFGVMKALSLLCQPKKSAGAGCTYSAGYYKAKGQFYTKDPKPGDQIFFGTSLSDCSHTGIVEKVDSSKVYTIEGNADDQVERCSYALNSSKIVGYGRPKFDPEPAAKEPAKESAKEQPQTAQSAGTVKKGDLVKVTGSAYYSGGTIPAWVKSQNWYVKEVSGDKAVIDKNENGTNAICSPVKISDLKVVKAAENAKPWTPVVGEIVMFKGTRHYATANAITGPTCKGGLAKITKIYELGKARHPYHLVAISGHGSTVYGWVDKGSFTKA